MRNSQRSIIRAVKLAQLQCLILSSSFPTQLQHLHTKLHACVPSAHSPCLATHGAHFSLAQGRKKDLQIVCCRLHCPASFNQRAVTYWNTGKVVKNIISVITYSKTSFFTVNEQRKQEQKNRPGAEQMWLFHFIYLNAADVMLQNLNLCEEQQPKRGQSMIITLFLLCIPLANNLEMFHDTKE